MSRSTCREGRDVDVVCLGILVADVMVQPFERLPEAGSLELVHQVLLRGGGCALNTASVVQQLGLRARVVGKVGADPLGEYLVGLMSGRDIDHAVVRDETTATSVTVVLIADDGERTFLHSAGANAVLTEEEVDPDLVFSGQFLHIGGALVMAALDGEPMARLLAEAQRRNIRTSLDTVFDATGTWNRLAPCFPHVDLFTPSLAEARAITDEQEPEAVADWLHAAGVGEVVITMGADGCFVSSPDFRGRVEGIEVRAVDSTGAGDSFAAGLLYGKLAGWPIERAARLANAVGAATTTALGASDGVGGLREALDLAELSSEVSS